MKQPAEYAREREEHPELPDANCERVSGYGVMGLPFASGHILGLRRWTASSIGGSFSSIWHRDPSGVWTFYETAPDGYACSRYFGGDAERLSIGPIQIEWLGPQHLHVYRDDGAVDWDIEIGSTAVTRAMSAAGSLMPLRAWRSQPVLRMMGWMAGRVLGVGRVQLTGTTSNRQHFDATPLRIWYVTGGHARVEGKELGPIGALQEQARMADFYFPQRGIFAVGRVFVTSLPDGVPAVPSQL